MNDKIDTLIKELEKNVARLQGMRVTQEQYDKLHILGEKLIKEVLHYAMIIKETR